MSDSENIIESLRVKRKHTCLHLSVVVVVAFFAGNCVICFDISRVITCDFYRTYVMRIVQRRQVKQLTQRNPRDRLVTT